MRLGHHRGASKKKERLAPYCITIVYNFDLTLTVQTGETKEGLLMLKKLSWITGKKAWGKVTTGVLQVNNINPEIKACV